MHTEFLDSEVTVDLPAAGDCFDRRCPSRAILSHVTGRWGSLVLAALRETGVLRFSELRNRIGGISEKMLAQTLRELERDGLLVRTSRPVVPPHVDYRLTDAGAGVAEHVAALVEWIETHVLDLIAAQHFHDGKMRAATSSQSRNRAVSSNQDAPSSQVEPSVALQRGDAA